MKFGGGPYMYGPCPHSCGCRFRGTILNVGELLLISPVSTHPPLPPGVRLANSLVRESRVCVCKIFCIRKEGYHPL